MGDEAQAPAAAARDLGRRAPLLRSPFFWVAVLYFTEGFPLGAFYELFPVYFRQQGVDLKSIGALSLLGLAWTLKFLWAPAIDHYRHHRRWMAAADLGMGLVMLAFAWQAGLPVWVWGAIAVFAVLSATNDIAIDGYTIEMLRRDEMGRGNGLRIGFYRVGMLSSGVVLMASDVLGWSGAFVVAAVLFTLCAAASLAAPRERRRERPPGPTLGSELRAVAHQPFALAALLALALATLWLVDGALRWSANWPGFWPVVGGFAAAALAAALWMRSRTPGDGPPLTRGSPPGGQRSVGAHAAGDGPPLAGGSPLVGQRSVGAHAPGDGPHQDGGSPLGGQRSVGAHTPRDAAEALARGPMFGALMELLRRPGILPVLVFVLTFKLADASMGFMVKPFWVDAGFSATEIGLVSVNIGLGLSIAGGLLGGWYCDRVGIFRALWVLGLAQAASNLGYALAAWLIPLHGVPDMDHRTLLYAASALESFTGGLGTAAFLAFLMAIVNREHSAAEYALLSSVFAASRSVAGWAGGLGAQAWGYGPYFLLTFFLAFPAYLLLPWVQRMLERNDGAS